ncbi:MAG: hypothetical protein IPK73_17605 [Candidatus Obscuribacter sp.]|nr:hypothetical protein [Candidatus Obscuribacter sp.]
MAHLAADSDTDKTARIKELRALKLEPIIEILRYGLESDKEAALVEAVAIDLIGVNELTNVIRGQGSSEKGRSSLEDLRLELETKEASITHKVLLVNIAQLYSYGMTPLALYEATRGVWKLDRARADNVEYAFAVYRGVVREVYEVASWFPAGTTEYFGRTHDSVADLERFEFVGRIADQSILTKYRGKSVRDQWTQGAQNPIKYINC